MEKSWEIGTHTWKSRIWRPVNTWWIPTLSMPEVWQKASITLTSISLGLSCPIYLGKLGFAGLAKA
jgi:hypothetical protein